MSLPSGYHPTLCHEHAQVKPCSGCEELDNYYEESVILKTDSSFTRECIENMSKAVADHGVQQTDFSIGISEQMKKDLAKLARK